MLDTSPTAAVVNTLKAAPAVAAIVSDRVYPVRPPQGAALPHITVTQVSGEDGYGLSKANGMTDAGVLVTALAATFSQAETLALEIKAATMHHRGEVGSAHVEMLRDGPDVADWIEAQKAFRRACQVRVVLSETV